MNDLRVTLFKGRMLVQREEYIEKCNMVKLKVINHNFTSYKRYDMDDKTIAKILNKQMLMNMLKENNII